MKSKVKAKIATVVAAPAEKKLPAVVKPDPTPMTLIQMAIQQNADPDRLDKLISLQERWDRNIAEKHWVTAMTAAQGEMGRISTDARNSQTNSNYATYAQLDRHLRPIYSKHGFSLSFSTAHDIPVPAEHVMVVCDVGHNKGFTKRYSVPMPIVTTGAKGNAVMTKTHATGSALSYGMRYLLKLIFNIAVGEDDDDGNGGQYDQRQPEQQQRIEKVTEAQAKELLDLAKAKKINPDKICAVYFIKFLRDLPADKYREVKERLINAGNQAPRERTPGEDDE